jgi:putative ABC transport system substrate-binding protein
MLNKQFILQIKRHDRFAWRYHFAISVFSLIFIICPVKAATNILVRVVVNNDSRYYQEFYDGMVNALDDDGKSNLTLIFSNNNTETEILNHKTKYDRNITIGVGVAATLSLLEQEVSGTIIGAMIPRLSFKQLSSKYPAIIKNVTPVYLDQPFDRQFALIRKLLPSADSVGIILSENTKSYQAEIKKAAEKYNLTLNSLIMSNNRRLGTHINTLTKQSDAIIVIYDPDVMESHHIKWLLYSAYQNRIPVFGYSQAFVKAGALGAVYTEPVDIGIQVAKLVNLLVKDKTTILEEYYPNTYTININESIADSLDINTN